MGEGAGEGGVEAVDHGAHLLAHDVHGGGGF